MAQKVFFPKDKCYLIWNYVFFCPVTKDLITKKNYLIKFIYSEKAIKFCEISTVDLFYVVTFKSTVEISQNFVDFWEYMNFNTAR